MNGTEWRAVAILGLSLGLSMQSLIPTPAAAQAAGAKTAGTPRDIDMTALFQHWIHSSEEEQPAGTVRIFRPATSMTFPPSRFRMAYKFARNGRCEYYVLSPDDAHHFEPCAWATRGRDRTILGITANGVVTDYRIVELSGKILRLALVEPKRGK